MKIKRLFLSFLMIMSVFCMVACKNNDGDSSGTGEKQDSVVTVTYDKSISRHAGQKLSTVELVLGAGSTSGVVVWNNPDDELEYGTHSYAWSFTPTDSTKYNAKTGTISINAKVALQDPQVTGVEILQDSSNIIYIDSLLKYVNFGAVASTASGTIEWKDPNQVLENRENDCEWVFTPTDTETYYPVTGFVKVTPSSNANQYLTSISVKSNSKASGYSAYDEFDRSGTILNLEYNAGKVENVQATTFNTSITYKNGTSLRKGDTAVTIHYQGKSCDVEIDVVKIKVLEKPVFTDWIEYDQRPHTLKVVENPEIYTFEPLTNCVDAGEYDLTLKLTDTENIKWADSQTDETIVKCYIQEAEFQVIKNEYSGEYDGSGHASVVISSYIDRVYYSLTELNETNYSQASTSPIEFENAGEYTIYFYAVGVKNYKDTTGSVSMRITKQTPVMKLQNLYTLVTNSVVHYPSEYVSLQSKQGEDIAKDNLKCTYYEKYSPMTPETNVKTQKFNSGSTEVGGAPAYYRGKDAQGNRLTYYVVVEYLGDNQNYSPVQSYVEMLIDKADNGFYASSGADSFAFKEHKTGDIKTEQTATIIGSNTAECDAYIEFKKENLNKNGIIEITFTSKFGTGDSSIKDGRLIFANNKYKLLFEDGTKVDLNGIYNLEGDSFDTLTVGFIDKPSRTLTKWAIPKYFDTYVAQTVTDADYNAEYNQGQNTEVTFYNDYGTIRFTATVNTKGNKPYDDLNLIEGGFERWAGVVIVNVEMVGKYLCYTLTCSITVIDKTIGSGDALTSTGFPADASSYSNIKFYWVMITDDPSSMSLHLSSSQVQDPVYSSLITDFTRV